MNKTVYIAVVDDHTAFRRGFCLLIDLLGDYSVLLDAAGPRDCIQQLNPARLPDILLVDIVMPGIDGQELTSWLSGHYPGIRILAMSALDDEQTIIRMFGAGARGFIQKDAEVADLRQALEDVMQYGFYCHEGTGRKYFRPVLQTGGDGSLGLPGSLTEPELVFLRLVSTGKTDAEIAADMLVSLPVVEGYRDCLCQKLQLTKRSALALYAICHGIAGV